MENKFSENMLTGMDGIVNVNGSLKQIVVLSNEQKKEQYQLSYEITNILDKNNYFLIYITYEDSTVETYFFPIQLLGYQSLIFDVSFKVASMQFCVYGNMTVKDTKLQAVFPNKLTEEQQIAIDKVDSNSEYWDRITSITNQLGNVITAKLEGNISTSKNSIIGSEGRMYWEDGKFICRDGTTDEESTEAMMFSPGGFMIASSKLDDGSWNWRTFGTGAGVTADEIVTGTLSAIAIKGVTITTSTLIGGSLIGATIEGGELSIGDDAFLVDILGNVGITKGTINLGNGVFTVNNNGDVVANSMTLKGGLISNSEILGGQLNIGDGKFKIDDLGNCTTAGNLTLGGNINITGAIKWASDSSPVKAQYSIDGSASWHDTFTSNDKYVRYSYDGGLTWTSAIKTVGDDGENGSDGSDAYVPSYITQTYIDSVEIKSPTISGNVVNSAIFNGGEYRTWESGVYGGAMDSTGLHVYNGTTAIGDFTYTNTNTEGNANAMLIQSKNGYALKILGSDNISISASSGKKVYIGDAVFMGDVVDKNGSPIGSGGVAVFG